MSDLIKREDAIKAIHNYWKKRLDTLPTKESEYGEVHADIQQIDKILEHNRTLCNFIKAIPSANRPQGEWVRSVYYSKMEVTEEYHCSECDYSPKYEGIPIVPANWTLRYCPNCGAWMRPKLQGKKFDSIIIDESAMKGAGDGTNND